MLRVTIEWIFPAVSMMVAQGIIIEESSKMSFVVSSSRKGLAFLFQNMR